MIYADSERSFCFLEIDEDGKKKIKDTLQLLLRQLMLRNPDIKYYQGLNVIAGSFLMVLNFSDSLFAIEAVCKYYLRYLFYNSILVFILFLIYSYRFHKENLWKRRNGYFYEYLYNIVIRRFEAIQNTNKNS